MKLFQQPTAIIHYDHISEFLDDYALCDSDYLLISKTIYTTFFQDRKLPCTVAFHSDFGKGEPDEAMLNAMLAHCRERKIHRIFAIGGGSVIDCAKILALQGTADAYTYFQNKIPLTRDKQLIVLPTTCGSGSEVSRISIAQFPSLQSKLGLANDALYPDEAILIPELLSTMNSYVFASSAIDALIHATESFLSAKSNCYTELYSEKAIQLILHGFQEIAEHGEEIRQQYLNDFLTASNYAGIAFGNTGTGSVHALSYPLSGTYHVNHGEANYQLFYEVLKMYETLDTGGKLSRLQDLYAQTLHVDSKDAFHAMDVLCSKLMAKKHLKDYGMRSEECISFTETVLETQQRLLSNSYVPLSKEHILSIYQHVYEERA